MSFSFSLFSTRIRFIYFALELKWVTVLTITLPPRADINKLLPLIKIKPRVLLSSPITKLPFWDEAVRPHTFDMLYVMGPGDVCLIYSKSLITLIQW